MKRIIFLVLVIFFKNTLLFAQEKIFISVFVNNQAITNVDIINEAKYLTALNPKIKDLDKKKILKIAEESIIREKIKEDELSKFINLEESSDLLNNIINDFYKRLQFNNLQDFENYLKNFDLSLNEVIKKIKIEARWNELIFAKYNNQVEINIEKLKKKIIEKNISDDENEIYFLNEIVFTVESKSTFKETYKKIIESINEIGFKNTANVYSVSDSARFGGEIGWVGKNKLNNRILEKLNTLKIGDVSKPIQVPGGYIILEMQDKKREKKKEKDLDQELNELIMIEKNKKLNEFSIIHFNKTKVNSSIVYEN